MQHYKAARTYQYAVTLSRAGHQILDRRLAEHCRLFNACVEHRRAAWSMARRSVSYADQNRELTLVRQDDPQWAGEHRRLAVGTLKRVDLAFKAFFRRVNAGETPGFPRFKPRSRFRTLDIHSGAERFVQVNTAGTKVTIRIKGLPAMRLRLHRPLPDGQPLSRSVSPRRRGALSRPQCTPTRIRIHLMVSRSGRWASMPVWPGVSPCLTAATSAGARSTSAVFGD